MAGRASILDFTIAAMSSGDQDGGAPGALAAGVPLTGIRSAGWFGRLWFIREK